MDNRLHKLVLAIANRALRMKRWAAGEENLNIYSGALPTDWYLEDTRNLLSVVHTYLKPLTEHKKRKEELIRTINYVTSQTD